MKIHPFILDVIHREEQRIITYWKTWEELAPKEVAFIKQAQAEEAIETAKAQEASKAALTENK